jgi:hypothetical protein
MKNILLAFFLIPTIGYGQKTVNIDISEHVEAKTIIADQLDLTLSALDDVVHIMDDGVANNGTSIITIVGQYNLPFSGLEILNIFCSGGDDIVDVISVDGNIPLDFVINIYGEDGDDLLTVHHAPPVIFPVNYYGGNQTVGDAMALEGTTSDKVSHIFNNANDGSVIVDDTRTITYTGLEPIADNLNTSNREFTFSAGSETIDIGDDPNPNDNISRINSSLGELVDFIHPTVSLTINAAGGDDAVNFSLLDEMFSLSELYLNGGPDTDDLIVDAQGSTFSDDGSTISLIGLYDLHYINFESVTLINAIVIPTLSQWGLMVLTLLTFIFGVAFIKRRNVVFVKN